MPVVAAILFEFCLRELRLRMLAHQPGRDLETLGWLHPAERLRVRRSGRRRRGAAPRQMLTMTAALARLDYRTADTAPSSLRRYPHRRRCRGTGQRWRGQAAAPLT
jgi:hypothetical protein